MNLELNILGSLYFLTCSLWMIQLLAKERTPITEDANGMHDVGR